MHTVCTQCIYTQSLHRNTKQWLGKTGNPHPSLHQPKLSKRGFKSTLFVCACALTRAKSSLYVCLVHVYLHVSSRVCMCESDPVLGALLWRVNSMSVCLSRPVELRLSAESKCYPVLGSMREHRDLSCQWPHLTRRVADPESVLRLYWHTLINTRCKLLIFPVFQNYFELINTDYHVVTQLLMN